MKILILSVTNTTSYANAKLAAVEGDFAFIFNTYRYGFWRQYDAHT